MNEKEQPRLTRITLNIRRGDIDIVRESSFINGRCFVEWGTRLINGDGSRPPYQYEFLRAETVISPHD